tara:strand:+ start:6396 stop:6671 length:276 start_codon:yes stop_codon:yes gene_type:complete
MEEQQNSGQNKPVTFLDMSAFKSEEGFKTARLLHNKQRDTFFLSADNGKTYRCQKNIDTAKPMAWIREEGAALETACLTNVNPQVEELGSI